MASRFEKKVRMVALGALAISALAASPALAGKTATTTTTTTLVGQTTTTTIKASPMCWVAPMPVTSVLPLYTVSGSGFPAGMVLNLYIKDKVSTWIVYGGKVPGGTVSSFGTFAIANLNASVFYPTNLGTKTVTVTNANDRRQTTLAQCTFSVQ